MTTQYAEEEEKRNKIKQKKKKKKYKKLTLKTFFGPVYIIVVSL